MVNFVNIRAGSGKPLKLGLSFFKIKILFAEIPSNVNSACTMVKLKEKILTFCYLDNYGKFLMYLCKLRKALARRAFLFFFYCKSWNKNINKILAFH